MDSFVIHLIGTDGSHSFGSIVRFTYEKERYTPYSYVTAEIVGTVNPTAINNVRLMWGTVCIHSGIADSVICEHSKSGDRIKLRSYGFSMLLGQNQAEPGLISSPDLSTIVNSGNTIYGVSCQSNTLAVNYIYFKEKTTIWDAVCIYAKKAYNSFPFIYGDNHLAVTRSSEKNFYHSSDGLVSYSKGVRLTNLISHGYMADMSGSYSYSETNSFASARHITKEKYYPLDSEWYSDPSRGIHQRMDYADRGRIFDTATYAGYSGEDITDHSTFPTISLFHREVSRVKIVGSSKGVFTTLSFYTDSYS